MTGPDSERRIRIRWLVARSQALSDELEDCCAQLLELLEVDDPVAAEVAKVRAVLR